MQGETSEAGKAIDGTTFYSTKSHVKFQLHAHYFRDGTLTTECRATYLKSNVSLKTSVQSNIKAGIGLRQYAADLFSHSVTTHFNKDCIQITMFSSIFAFYYYVSSHSHI